MTDKAFNAGYNVGIEAANALPDVKNGYPDIPACPYKATKQRNAFAYGFRNGFVSVSSLRR